MYKKDYFGMTPVIKYDDDQYVIEFIDNEEIVASIQFEEAIVSTEHIFDLYEFFKDPVDTELYNINILDPDEYENFKLFVVNRLTDEVFEYDKAIYISYLFTEIEYQQLGLASKLMSKLIEYCDNEFPNIPIVLSAAPYREFALNREGYLPVLISFYEKFGFEVVTKYRDSAFMIKSKISI